MGAQAPANLLVEAGEGDGEAFPLTFHACEACGHGQLGYFVDPSVLFRRYLYASGTSRTLNEYFDWFAARVAALVGEEPCVLEIACNDGSLLARLKAHGVRATGVDPAANLVDGARRRGLEVICDFWPTPQLDGRRFDAIIAQNVLAHTPDPLHFLTRVRESLEPHGVCLVQTSQAAMLSNGEFDTVYHEHCSFFTVASMRALAQRAGLLVRRVSLVSVHGTSLLCWLTRPGGILRADDPFAEAPFGVDVQHFTAPEVCGTIDDLRQAYRSFGDRARERMAAVRAHIHSARAEGREIALVGAAAKAISFARAAALDPDRIYDEAPLKIGRRIPGIAPLVQPLTDIAELRRETMFIISAWNFREELEAKVRALYQPPNAAFLTYFPRLERF